MIELAFIVCLQVELDHCEERSLLFYDVGIMQCMIHGQAQLAAWANQHDGWQIESWKCRFHDLSAADT